MQDSLLYLSQAQAITVTAPSTNVLDQLVVRDIGAGNALMVHVWSVQAFATLTSLQISWQGSPTAGGAGTYYDLILSPVIPVANLTANTRLMAFVIPPRGWLLPSQGVLAPAQYYRLNFTVAGSNATAGTINAWVNAEPDMEQFTVYKRNYTV